MSTERYHDNKEERKKYNRKYNHHLSEEKKEYIREYNRNWRKANPEKKKALDAAWRKANLNKMASYNAKRRATKLAQSPTLTPEEHQQVLDFYAESKALTESTGIEHHVDHIHPLSKGGLHHPDNLQVITAEENLRKADKIKKETVYVSKRIRTKND